MVSLYGMTSEGGASGDGIIFEWNTEKDTLIKKIDFNRADNGRLPNGVLVMADNGKLYGMTPFGGEYNDGVLFEWDPVTDSVY